MVTRAPGLRERKKLHTRQALSWAAVRLAVERGLENVLVDDIAAAAGVSARTFNNYFSSKAEAIAARHLDRSRRAVAEFRTRPREEALWTAISHAVLSQYASDPSGSTPDWVAGIRLMISEPALRGEFLRAETLAEEEFAVVVGERTGTDPERDLYPRLVAAAVGAVGRVAIHRWLSVNPPGLLEPLLSNALDQIAAGLPDPSVSSAGLLRVD
ncbi:TetR family transcriptional regulator [Saccharopolyspora erythraea]|uniref:acyl-CoA-like ligand-binding transcription factor n=1 Tax=Saccharopolyspora erythraea TaxID=1836 RepID=UPI001BAB9B47|nr:TetR family transcriptional regulator [Saccharopolyspora erythraea]QUH00312.1 TetR family transcriptional regulator [Saccharopolyspora erythraea]